MNINHFNYELKEGICVDEVDIRILELLQKDGRMTISDLSKELSLSRPSVSERLARLQEKGIIEGFFARVSPKAVGRNILVYIQIGELKVPCHKFEQFIKKDTDITECHRVTGNFSYLMKAYVSGMENLERLVDRLIPYGLVNTSIVLSSPVPYGSLLPGEYRSESSS